jgi:hypothetical protein
MHMAKALIAAVLLAAVLIAAVAIPAALTRGTFGFDAWPEANAAKAREEAVVIAEPADRRRSIAHTKPRKQRPAEHRSADVPAPSTGTPSLPETVVRADPPAARDGAEQPRRDAPEPEHEADPAPEVPSAPAEELAQTDEPTGPQAPEIEARPAVEALPEAAEELPPVTPPGWGVHPRDGREQGNRPPWAGRGHRDDKN